jgi:hypothetical protein
MTPISGREGRDDGARRLMCRSRAGTGSRRRVRLGETTVTGFLVQARIR